VLLAGARLSHKKPSLSATADVDVRAKQIQTMSTLKGHLKKLEIFLQSNTPEYVWSDVLIGNESDLYKDGKVIYDLNNALFTVEEFEPIFNEILNYGYSWVNLSAVGIIKNNLIVCVEKPSHSSGTKKEQVSVNYSGSVKKL